MTREQLGAPEMRTHVFFDRPADLVVGDFTEGVYEKHDGKVTVTKGQAKILEAGGPEGDRAYRITLAEAYQETEAIRVWKGRRAEQIRALAPGETVTYRSRAGELTFVKTRGADNILIRGLEDVGTGKKIQTPTEVSRTLGLSHGDEGRFTFTAEGRLRLERL